MSSYLGLKSGITALVVALCTQVSYSQQVVQRGSFGTPAQVIDETDQWSTPLQLASAHDVSLYIPDVSNPTWLARNYRSFEDTGQYVLSMYTFYRTPAACRINQIAWGFSDAAHVDACTDITYRLRQGLVDSSQKTVTLQMAAMVDHNGEVIPDSIERRRVTRSWSELDDNTRAALERANSLITRQMKLYDALQQQKR